MAHLMILAHLEVRIENKQSNKVEEFKLRLSESHARVLNEEETLSIEAKPHDPEWLIQVNRHNLETGDPELFQQILVSFFGRPEASFYADRDLKVSCKVIV
jgi:hypothetical protein